MSNTFTPTNCTPAEETVPPTSTSINISLGQSNSDGGNQTDETYQTDIESGTLTVTNDLFITTIFSTSFDSSVPLVCSKRGKLTGGWVAKTWPCDTTDSELNWYCAPAIFKPDDTGQYHAKNEYAVKVFAVMLDDIGTKVPVDAIKDCPPSWLLETSPNNYQAGYIFSEPIADIAIVEKFKKLLLNAGLCDKGATGATTRWMRMPKAVNSKPEYGQPPPRCRLKKWNPETRYTIQQLTENLLPKNSKQNKNLSNFNSNTDISPNTVIEKLQSKGLYKKSNKEGIHEITCPWVNEHTGQKDGGAYYLEPTTEFPNGGFKCHHSHGENLHINELFKFLDISKNKAQVKTEIEILGGQLDSICDDAEKELALVGNYYQNGGVIVSANTNPETSYTSITVITQPSLLRALSTIIDWYRVTDTGRYLCDPPSRHVNVLFKGQVYKHLPPLLGLARQPYLREDASVVFNSGYDNETKIIGAFDAVKFPIMELPRKHHAENALTELRSLLLEFDFATEYDRSAALAAMLTAAIRPSIPLAPMFHIKAPQIASGKSYLSSIIGAFTGPRVPSATSFPTNDEECQKLLLATLIESPACIIFDNLTTDISPFKTLCSALTEEHITGRILGISKTATVGTRTLFLSSGNNVEPIRDMTRRCITIHLEPKVEVPASRSYAADPLQQIRKKREHYVALAITIIRGYVMAGRPQTKVKSFASYETWSSLIRQSLLWLGLPDPAERIFEQLAYDPDKELLARLLTSWHENHEDEPLMIRDILAYVSALSFEADRAKREELKDILLEIANQHGKVNRHRLGKWLSRHQGRVVNGLRLERAKGSTSSERWAVKSV